MRSHTSNIPYIALLGILIYAYGAYSYASLRFNSPWSDADSAYLTAAIASTTRSGSLLSGDSVYGNGMVFQSLAVFLTEILGVTPQVLQSYIMPLIAPMLTLVGFVTYRTLTGSSSAGLIATLFLFLQPDILFVTWRGSHEKITWLLALVLIFLLIKGFTTPTNQTRFVKLVIMFYIVAFAFVGTNIFFASSFVTAVALSFLIGNILLQLRHRMHGKTAPEIATHNQRLLLTTLATGVLIYLFFFYIYPPSLILLRSFGSLLESLSALFLNTQVTSHASNPYATITKTWIDSRIYLILSSISLLILFSSLFIWVIGALRFLILRNLPKQELAHLFTWQIYPAFAFQVAISVLADRSDTVGSNVQLRLLTPFMLTAIPIMAIGIIFIHRRLPRILRILFGSLVPLSVACFTVFSLAKATNEPVISNNWTFNSESERATIIWINDHSDRDEAWVGYGIRLMVDVSFHQLPGYMKFNAGENPAAYTRYYVVSDLEYLRWLRLNMRNVYLADKNIIYDNGTARIFYRLPTTRYQP